MNQQYEELEPIAIIRHTILDGNVGGTHEDAVAYAHFLESQWREDCAGEDVVIDIRVERNVSGVPPRTWIDGNLRASLTDPNVVFDRWLQSLNAPTTEAA